VDIVGQRLWSLDLGSGETRHWDMPEPIGWVIEREGRDDFIAGFKSGFAVVGLDPLTIEPICDPEPDRSHNRLNDAKVDPAGRIWAGTKDDRDQEAIGALYRLDPDLSVSRHDDFYQVTNGPAFSPDGRYLYHNDSGARLVYRFELRDDGSLGEREIFIRFADEWGYPDGMTTDVDGGLWIAHWGGGRLSRFDPGGRLERSIHLPASNITSCAFAGDRLDRLFVTSASLGVDGEEKAGSLFEVEAGTRGLPAKAFAG